VVYIPLEIKIVNNMRSW